MFDEEIEKAMLFYVIFEDETYDLSEKDFSLEIHKKIINAVNKLRSRKEEINILTVREEIDRNSSELLEYLAKIGDYVSHKVNSESAYKVLKELTKKREILNLVHSIQTKVSETENVDIFIEKIIAELQKIEFQTQKEENFVTQVVNTSQMIEKNIMKKEDYSLYTGFFDLDDLTDGLHRGELTIVGARPAVGKTTFALQIAEKLARNKIKVAYVSLEMSAEQIIQKILAKRTNINSRKIRNGELSEKEIEMLGLDCMNLGYLPITILTKINTIQQIEIETRRLVNKNQLDVLMIDYLQLVKNERFFKSREQEVADISRTLKLLSLELDIPIVALCQLNRNASKSEPTLSDIRESGSIEQDADNVIFLYPAENDLVTVDLQKQRTGNTGTLKLKFKRGTSEFINIER